MSAREEEVTAAIDKVLRIRAGNPAQPREEAQPGSASGAASAAAAGAPGLSSEAQAARTMGCRR